MGSSRLFMFIPLLLAALLAVNSSAAAGPAAAPAPAPAGPVIHFISKVATPIKLYITFVTGPLRITPVQVSPGQDYLLTVKDQQISVAVVAKFGTKNAVFFLYFPRRDLGKAAIYWRANDDGLYISYDNTNFKKARPWVSE